MRALMLTLATFIATSLISTSLVPSAHAQETPGRSALEIGFAHGAAQLREPGEPIEWTGAVAALDLRLHAPSGFGGMLRAGTTLGKILTLEVDAAATYRAWVVRRGPRGLELGGGLGVSVLWNELAPRIGIDTSLAAGGFFTVQLDYREHGFFVGIGYQARWLPLRQEGQGLDTFTFSATGRVGGEITL